MKSRASLIVISFVLLFSASGCKENTEVRTFCNPLNLDYGWGNLKLEKIGRHSADPVIVLFKGRYYLFATMDIGGYRVSDDLMNWHNVYFEKEIYDRALEIDHYVAPAVAADDNYMYFLNFNRQRDQATTPIIRSSDPGSGKWEICGEVRRVADPCIYIENGKYYVYYGLGGDHPTRVFELDPKTMTEIPGSDIPLKDSVTNVAEADAGYHFGRREIWDEIEAPHLFGKFRMMPCTEGAWIVKNAGRYYLQYATPGTICNWYCDVVMEGDTPTGPFTETDYNPVSLKVGGFISGAGHSCVFQDKYRNWWQITTMWIGNHDPFERRLGLFPVSFDARGRMTTHCVMGDYPMIIPQKKFDPSKEYLAGWWALSYGKSCTTSSSLGSHTPELASDENSRTWWSAETGHAGEWFAMDLGKECTVNAIQVNFADQDYEMDGAKEDDYHAYKLYYSTDGVKWNLLVDKSLNRTAAPHDYIQLPEAIGASHIKIENVHAAQGGKFALLDLRVFGKGNSPAPVKVTGTKAMRDKQDDRYATLAWEKSDNADGYFVRFGYSPDFLNQSIQVKGKEKNDLAIHILKKGVKYYYRVDAYNDSGVTQGEITEEQEL